MKTWHAIGLGVLAICALLGMLVSPYALLIPTGFFALLLFLQHPEVLALGAIAIGLMPHAQMIDLALPSLGLNLLDLVVLMMLAVTLLRWPQVQATVAREKLLSLLVLFVVLAGLVALLHGYLEGFLLRAAFRSFRFYFHLAVTFFFAALIRRPWQQQTVVFGSMLLVPIQVLLLSMGRLVYSPDDPGTLLLAPDIYWTSTHFLPVKSFYPALVALAVLALAGGRRLVGLKGGLWVLVGLQVTVLAFTYKRSQYVGFVAGLLLLAVGMLIVEVHRRHRWVPVLVRLFVVALVLAGVTGGAFSMALRSAPLEASQVRANLLRRALFVQEVETDAPIQGRFEGFRVGWNDIQRNPLLGTGLGDSVTYIRAEVFHSGWLWVAVSAGPPAAFALALAILVACVKTLRTLGSPSELPMTSALRLGFLACLAALTGNALFWGSTLDIADVFDWGLLIGLLVATMPRESPRELPVGVAVRSPVSAAR